jgi:ribosome-binding factor A
VPGQNRRGRSSHTRRYPRTARLNEVLREILAEALEHVSGNDDRLELVTITGIECESDLRHAIVFYSARTEGAEEALQQHRVKLQSYIAKETRLKRTPQLSFVVDSGVTSGWRIEELLKGLDQEEEAKDEPRDERGS